MSYPYDQKLLAEAQKLPRVLVQNDSSNPGLESNALPLQPKRVRAITYDDLPPTKIKTPFWRTGKGLITLAVLVMIVLAGVLGGVLGSQSQRRGVESNTHGYQGAGSVAITTPRSSSNPIESTRNSGVGTVNNGPVTLTSAGTPTSTVILTTTGTLTSTVTLTRTGTPPSDGGGAGVTSLVVGKAQ